MISFDAFLDRYGATRFALRQRTVAATAAGIWLLAAIVLVGHRLGWDEERLWIVFGPPAPIWIAILAAAGLLGLSSARDRTVSIDADGMTLQPTGRRLLAAEIDAISHPTHSHGTVWTIHTRTRSGGRRWRMGLRPRGFQYRGPDPAAIATGSGGSDATTRRSPDWNAGRHRLAGIGRRDGSPADGR